MSSHLTRRPTSHPRCNRFLQRAFRGGTAPPTTMLPRPSYVPQYQQRKRKNRSRRKSEISPTTLLCVCMFGHKQLPAWASCVSSELAHILHNECIRVIGVLIDDFLFHGPASIGPEGLQEELDRADEIMEELGVPPNDKGQDPDTSVVF